MKECNQLCIRKLTSHRMYQTQHAPEPYIPLPMGILRRGFGCADRLDVRYWDGEPSCRQSRSAGPPRSNLISAPGARARTQSASHVHTSTRRELVVFLPPNMCWIIVAAVASSASRIKALMPKSEPCCRFRGASRGCRRLGSVVVLRDRVKRRGGLIGRRWSSSVPCPPD